MYKIVFFKLFLFVLYTTAGIMSKWRSATTNGNEQLLKELERTHNGNNNQNNRNNNYNRRPNQQQDLNHIGQATLWVNPFVTRFKKPTTTPYTTTTTTTTTRRTARPRPKLKKRIKRKTWIT